MLSCKIKTGIHMTWTKPVRHEKKKLPRQDKLPARGIHFLSSAICSSISLKRFIKACSLKECGCKHVWHDDCCVARDCVVMWTDHINAAVKRLHALRILCKTLMWMLPVCGGGNGPDCFLISLVDHRMRWATTVWSATVCEHVNGGGGGGVCVCICVCVRECVFLRRGDLPVAVAVPDHVITPT